MIFPKFASLVAIYHFLNKFHKFLYLKKLIKKICVKDYNKYTMVSTTLEKNGNLAYVCTFLSLTIGPIALNL